MPCQFMVCLFQAGGLGSSMGGQGRSGVDLGTASPQKEQRETFAANPQGTGSASGLAAALLLPSQVGKKGQSLPRSSQDMPSGVWAMGPGQEAGAAQGAPARNCSWRARTGSLGPRPSVQPPAPPAAEGARCFLPGRPRPGSSPPWPPRARRCRPGTRCRRSAEL